MGNFTNIPSDIRSLFLEKRRSLVMNAFTCLLEDINLDCRSLGGIKRENCRLTNLQVFQILVLFPFFAIKGYSHYAGSALNRMFGCRKDMFYSYSVARQPQLVQGYIPHHQSACQAGGYP